MMLAVIDNSDTTIIWMIVGVLAIIALFMWIVKH